MPLMTPADVRVGDMEFRRGAWRRWDGLGWRLAEHALRPARLKDVTPYRDEERLDDGLRRRVLDRAVQAEVLSGAHVVHRGEGAVIVGRLRRVHHLGHALMTLITGGLWVVVWLVSCLNRREDRTRLMVDPWGNVWPVGVGVGEVDRQQATQPTVTR